MNELEMAKDQIEKAIISGETLSFEWDVFWMKDGKFYYNCGDGCCETAYDTFEELFEARKDILGIEERKKDKQAKKAELKKCQDKMDLEAKKKFDEAVKVRQEKFKK